MAAKRALIVDDSKSARVVLSRMLQKYGIEVDTVESAEAAIEYLRQNRPDVIFMDHLMPGMDGFQAVQAIKSNPHTATIPIMMYTSQQGELYVGQARALGAVGVLPKLVKPIDVSKVLYQLHLLPERRDAGPSAFVTVETADKDAAEAPPVRRVEIERPEPVTPLLPADWHPQMESALRNHDAELRRFILASLDSFADRLSGETRNFINETPALQALPPPPEPRPPYLWIVAVLVALVPAVVLALLYTRSLETNRAVAMDNARLEQTNAQLRQAVEQLGPHDPMQPVEQTDGANPTSSVAEAAAAGAGAVSAAEPVPYGEIPFALRRVEVLRDLLPRLEAQSFRGEIHLESFAGEFCLTGSVAEGYAIAAPELPVAKCDLIGNPFDTALSPAQRQSLGFANLISGVQKRTSGGIVIKTSVGDERNVAPYPASGPGVTAGQWNEAALRNNRVEIKVIPSR